MQEGTLSRTSGTTDLLRVWKGADQAFVGHDGRPVRHDRRGLVAAQSAVAAGHTVDTAWRWIHAVHTHHLADGDPSQEVEYRVESLGETDHASTRLVRARQGTTTLGVTTVAFQTVRPGRPPVHQLAEPRDWPDPHTLAHAGSDAGPLEFRDLDGDLDGDLGGDATARTWVRWLEELPDLRQLHAAAVVLAAELMMARVPVPDARRPGSSGGSLPAESLDLTVRFHRAFRADDWMRHECSTPVADDYRNYLTSTFSSPMGRLVATASQERSVRHVDPIHPPHREP